MVLADFINFHVRLNGVTKKFTPATPVFQFKYIFQNVIHYDPRCIAMKLKNQRYCS
jgi:hypothetical protein